MSVKSVLEWFRKGKLRRSLGLVVFVVGIAGIPGDMKTWQIWINEMFDFIQRYSDFAWIALVIGLGILFAPDYVPLFRRGFVLLGKQLPKNSIASPAETFAVAVDAITSGIGRAAGSAMTFTIRDHDIMNHPEYIRLLMRLEGVASIAKTVHKLASDMESKKNNEWKNEQNLNARWVYGTVTEWHGRLDDIEKEIRRHATDN